uniref:Uncharacterized protein n=1 Tax=Nelumbo nucifera TaxID=4432 RepID=A0A822XHY2_NELNU|nr:TPA_asm: hypothetical protein HUJ06_020204 [Nelumbo nucifera]
MKTIGCAIDVLNEKCFAFFHVQAMFVIPWKSHNKFQSKINCRTDTLVFTIRVGFWQFL